jgi:hypothetical protein
MTVEQLRSIVSSRGWKPLAWEWKTINLATQQELFGYTPFGSGEVRFESDVIKVGSETVDEDAEKVFTYATYSYEEVAALLEQRDLVRIIKRSA